MNKFILEIGTEEIPSIYIDNILKNLKNSARNYLEQSNVDYDGIDTWGTPRRLILYVEGISSVPISKINLFITPFLVLAIRDNTFFPSV